MVHDLNEHVLWPELAHMCGLDENFSRSKKNLELFSLGNCKFVNLKTIKDPLLALEAKCCTPMNKFYPLKALADELGLSPYTVKEMRISDKVVNMFGSNLFIIPDSIFNRKITNKRVIVNLISNKEEEEGYETVVEITSRFKLGGYSADPDY